MLPTPVSVAVVAVIEIEVEESADGFEEKVEGEGGVVSMTIALLSSRFVAGV